MTLLTKSLNVVWLIAQTLDTLRILQKPKPRRKKQHAIPGEQDGELEGVAAQPAKTRMSTLKRDQWKRILKGWVIWVIWGYIEETADTLFESWLPFYGFLKMLILLGLTLPRYSTLPYIYDNYLLPRLSLYSPSIDLSASLLGLLGKWCLQMILLGTAVPILMVYEGIMERLWWSWRAGGAGGGGADMDVMDSPHPPGSLNTRRPHTSTRSHTTSTSSPPGEIQPNMPSTPPPAPKPLTRRKPRKSLLHDVIDFSFASPVTLRTAMSQARVLCGQEVEEKRGGKGKKSGLGEGQVVGRGRKKVDNGEGPSGIGGAAPGMIASTGPSGPAKSRTVVKKSSAIQMRREAVPPALQQAASVAPSRAVPRARAGGNPSSSLHVASGVRQAEARLKALPPPPTHFGIPPSLSHLTEPVQSQSGPSRTSSSTSATGNALAGPSRPRHRVAIPVSNPEQIRRGPSDEMDVDAPALLSDGGNEAVDDHRPQLNAVREGTQPSVLDETSVVTPRKRKQAALSKNKDQDPQVSKIRKTTASRSVKETATKPKTSGSASTVPNGKPASVSASVPEVPRRTRTRARRIDHGDGGETPIVEEDETETRSRGSGEKVTVDKTGSGGGEEADMVIDPVEAGPTGTQDRKKIGVKAAGLKRAGEGVVGGMDVGEPRARRLVRGATDQRPVRPATARGKARAKQ